MKKNSIFVLFVLLILASCTSNKGVDSEVLQSEITSISCPKTAISDKDVKVTVSFTGPSGCAEPFNIKANKVGQTVTLSAFYKSNNSQPCTHATVNLELDYSFFADLPGTYFFISDMNSSIADTLIVY